MTNPKPKTRASRAKTSTDWKVEVRVKGRGPLSRAEVRRRIQAMLSWVLGDATLDQLVKSARVTNADLD